MSPSGIAALEEEDSGRRLSRHVQEAHKVVDSRRRLDSRVGRDTMWRLLRLVNIITQSGNPDEDFFYLGGPMTGIPKFNFPRFREVGDKLRAKGYNIISPAELDDPETEAAALASPDGAPGSGCANGEDYEDFLGRDLIICSLPKCIGMIAIEGWENSRGACGESWVIGFLKKQFLLYSEDHVGKPVLTAGDRDKELRWLLEDSRVAGLLPTDIPGLRTVASREETTAGFEPYEPHPLALEPLGPIR